MPRDVFISHVEEDAAVAQALARELRGCGRSTWMYEEDGVPGVSYLTQIFQAIEECRVFVLVASPTSVHAHQVIREVEQAHERGMMIIPVRLGLTHQQYGDSEPILRVATGTAVTLQATPDNVPDLAQRIAAAMDFGKSDEAVPEVPSAAPPLPIAPPARTGWRRWPMSTTVGVSAAILAGVIAAIALYPKGASRGDLSPLHTIRVTDAGTGKPILDASVEAELGQPLRATSDDEGEIRFELKPTDPPVAKVIVRADRYVTRTRWLELRQETLHALKMVSTASSSTQAAEQVASPRPADAPLPAEQAAATAPDSPNVQAAALQPLPCVDERSLRSLSGEAATAVRFSNLRASEVVVYWLDFQGKREFFQRVPSRTEYVQPTYVTHPWLVADSGDRCLAIYQPTPEQAVALVR
jgi:hypothetical protein